MTFCEHHHRNLSVLMTALTIQTWDLPTIEKIFTKDLKIMEEYFLCGWLKPNPAKTLRSSFHLNNWKAREELHVDFCSQQMRHDHTPKYLSVTLKRSLAYHHPHLTKYPWKNKDACESHSDTGRIDLGSQCKNSVNKDYWRGLFYCRILLTPLDT